MTDVVLDLTIDRLVIEGLDLPADAARDLEPLITAELRRILATGGGTTDSPADGLGTGPVLVTGGADLPALARALAERIAREATAAGGRDG
jgi:hypothetical protein